MIVPWNSIDLFPMPLVFPTCLGPTTETILLFRSSSTEFSIYRIDISFMAKPQQYDFSYE
jgi:hypothetical protein